MANRIDVMANEHDGASLFRHHVVHFTETFFLKLDVADGQHFVDQENFRIEVGRDGKREPDIHAARIALDRCVEKLLDLGKSNDLVELLSNFGAAHTKNGAVQK